MRSPSPMSLVMLVVSAVRTALVMLTVDNPLIWRHLPVPSESLV